MTADILAIIPARGGSKGIPRKNIVDVLGKPLLAHSIQHALEAETVTRVLVSSEDAEILEIADRYGAETIVRPVHLAGDTVLDWPVFQHCLQELEAKDGYTPQYVVHLRPTAPFRKKGWIDSAVRLLQETPEADAVRSVSEPMSHPYRVFRLDTQGFLNPIMLHEHPTPSLLRRQDLPKMYYYNCVIDVTRRSTLLEKMSMTGDRLFPFIIDQTDAMDIDSPLDLEIVRFLMEKKKS